MRNGFAVILTMALAVQTVRADEADAAAIVESVGTLAVEKDKVAGLTIGVAKGDTVLCVKPFGLANVEHVVVVSDQTVFRIGSITKQFTAAAVLLLVEDGKIKLDDRLTRYMPDYPLPAGNVTVHQLLQHTSGIKDLTRLPTYRRDRQVDASPDEVLGRFRNLPLQFDPGEKHQYCNSGYILLRHVIEKASGESYKDFVQKRQLDVAGLKDTYCDERGRIIPNRAAGYSRWSGKLRNAPHVSLRQSVGAGNMASTARDLLLWQQAIVAGRVLNENSLALMHAKGRLNSGKEFNYGMGVFIRELANRKVIRHGGGISGFRSDLAWYPESGYIIAVVTNSDNAKASQISDRIARRLLAPITQKPR
jgi:D-alanyl-D-alanine carboxypeptidase